MSSASSKPDAQKPDPGRVAQLFERVVDLPLSEARAVLDEACGEDRVLRREVMELLAQQETKPEGRTRSVAPAEKQPLEIGRFTVIGKLGAGGMGVVYEGRDPTLGRPVALKLVLRGGGSEGKARLLREAQAMARVSHPNVVPVYEVGLHGEGVFVAMELVAGETLTAWLKKEPRTWRDILGKLVQAGRGLGAAHDAGVLHRDFKPDNVLIGSDGRARVLDFGLARSLAKSDEDELLPASTESSQLEDALTQEGVVMGTPAYMSPEHFDGPLGPASDQWSFAVSAYRTLFGDLPFKGGVGEIRALIQEPPPAPTHHEEIPPSVVAAVMRGLSRQPEDRFPSMSAMADELESVLTTDPETDGSVSRRQRRRAAFALAGMGAANFFIAGFRTGFTFDIGLRGAMIQGLCGLIFTIATVTLLRKALFKTRYNRRIITFLLLLLATQLAHRLYAMSVGMTMVDTLRVDAIFTITLALLGMIFIERWFAWQAALAALYLVATFFSDWIVAPGFGFVMVGGIAFGIYYWREPARGQSGTGGTSSSGSSSRSKPSARQ